MVLFKQYPTIKTRGDLTTEFHADVARVQCDFDDLYNDYKLSTRTEDTRGRSTRRPPTPPLQSGTVVASEDLVQLSNEVLTDLRELVKGTDLDVTEFKSRGGAVNDRLARLVKGLEGVSNLD
jgi:hypothetical protein